MKTVVIVDDENSGHSLIKEYSDNHQDLRLIGQAYNGIEAIEIINKLKPNLVFMDVQMPSLSGFDVIEHLLELPSIIFSTAYDKYALKAFDVHAVDYLLKPYTRDRFDKAIAKLDSLSVKQIGPMIEQHIMSKTDYPERIIVEKGSRYVTLAVADIFDIEAYGDYSKLFDAKDKYISNRGISSIEEKLDPKKFLRVHRSSIVALNAIQQITKFNKGYLLVLKNEKQIKVSRGYSDKIKALIY